VRAGEGLDDVAHAAARAAAEPGTEVAGTEIAGNPRGPRGRWAVLLRRRRPRLPVRGEPTEEPSRGEPSTNSSTVSPTNSPTISESSERAVGTSVTGG
jgi:hypothetical protein